MISEWLTYSVPWWLWIVPATVGAVGVFLLVTRFLGVRMALNAAVVFGALSAIAIAVSRGRQRGWQDRKEKERRDAQNIIDRIDAARAERDGKLHDDDGFKRDGL